MPHANARTNLYARSLIVSRVAAGHLPGEVAKQLGVSRSTVYTWLRRYRELGRAGLADRSSRPHRSPARTGPDVQDRIRAARDLHHAGPVALSGLLGLPASTIGAVIARLGLPRLSEIDRVTGDRVRARTRAENRYEHPAPGDLLHVDVKKLGRIPPGGGWRVHGRTAATHHSAQGWDFVHVAVDDHSRAAYAEVHPDEKATTCAGFLTRATGWFTGHQVTVTRVLTDNAKAYRTSKAWATACDHLAITATSTQPRHPWTNGKAERFNRTLLTEWAYSQPWTTNTDRTRALDTYLTHYNTGRGHSALAGAPPTSRLPA